MWMPKPNRLEILVYDNVNRLAPIGKLIRIVLLLAIKDGATEIRFHPDRRQNLEFLVGDVFYDLVPVPEHTLEGMSAELQQMAEPRLPVRAFTRIRSLLGLGTLRSAVRRPFKGRFRLQIDGKQIQVLVRITPIPSGPQMILRLINPAMAAPEAKRLVQELWRRSREHVRNV